MTTGRINQIAITHIRDSGKQAPEAAESPCLRGKSKTTRRREQASLRKRRESGRDSTKKVDHTAQRFKIGPTERRKGIGKDPLFSESRPKPTNPKLTAVKQPGEGSDHHLRTHRS